MRENIPISLILKRAEDCLDQVDQWRDSRDPAKISFLENAVRYASSAEALVGLVESFYCGSVGGYAKGQTSSQRDTLKNRLDFLKEKFKS